MITDSTLPEEEFLNEARAYCTTVAGANRDRWLHWGSLEDLIQEGVIYAWRDLHSEKEYTKLHCFHRASERMNTIARPDSHATLTGHIAVSTDFKTNAHGEATREKVYNWVQEYWTLHGKKPTAAMVAKGVGLSLTNANIHIRATKNGLPTRLAEKNANGRYVAPKPVPLVNTAIEDSDSEWHARKLGRPSAEKEYLDSRAVQDILAAVKNEQHRAALYYYYIEDMSWLDVADMLGVPDPNRGQKARRMAEHGMEQVKRAVQQGRVLLD